MIDSFKDLGVSDNILSALAQIGFERPMPVQAAVIPVILTQNRDIVALAQTGTGKTAAFGIPTLQQLNTADKRTEVLVLCPTRELCMQITKDLQNYSKHLSGASVVAVYGGANIEQQQKQLAKGAKIIVATPGRLLDLIRRGSVDFTQVNRVILDEADEMLDMGFKEDLDTILAETPAERNTLLFSATMPAEVERIARRYMQDPMEITIGNRNGGTENVKHYYYLVHAKDRYLALKRIADFYPDIYSIVFCRTRAETQQIAEMLIADGYSADALHGDLSQAQRDQVMNRFRNKSLQMLVATDVAARGIDVQELSHVINYNLPDEAEQYTHRSGRTGRADKTGISIAIIHQKEKGKIKQLEKILGRPFAQAKIPTGKEVCAKQLFHMVNELEHATVNYGEIEAYLPIISKKLEWLDKEELIQKFISLEFNRFLDYYRNAPDLNVREEASVSPRSKEGKKKKGAYQIANDEPFSRLYIQLGKKDQINPKQLIGFINHSRIPNVNIGRIDIMETFSYVDVSADVSRELMHTLDGCSYKGRQICVKPANREKDGGKAPKHKRRK